MNSTEFNEKYKEYLGERHYGLALDNSNVIEYLDKEFQEFIKIPGFQYYQIKSKFNWISFYCSGLTSEKVYEVEKEIENILKNEKN